VELSPSPSASQRGDVPDTIYETNRTHLQEERAAQPRGCLLCFSLSSVFLFLLSLSLSLSLVYPESFPWPIKGKAGHPIRGILFLNIGRDFNFTSLSPET
jgi:hypothetical protein